MIHLSIISYAHAWSKPDFFYHTTVTINIIQSHYYSFFFLSSSSRVECDLTKGIFLGPFPPPSTWHRTMKTSGPGSQTSPPIDMRVCVHILRMMSFYFKVAMHLNSDTSSDMNVSFEPQTSNSHDYIYQMSPHHHLTRLSRSSAPFIFSLLIELTLQSPLPPALDRTRPIVHNCWI